MAKILAFGASTSSTSINKKFAKHVAGLVSNDFNLIDLNDFTTPIYSSDLEKNQGIPEAAKRFNALIRESSGLIISLAEHNGSYTAAFKNLFDWSSRENSKVFEGKKLFLLATSPGPRGGLTVLEAAATRFPFHGAMILAKFSLPSFGQNFSDGSGVVNPELQESLMTQVTKFKSGLLQLN